MKIKYWLLLVLMTWAMVETGLKPVSTAEAAPAFTETKSGPHTYSQEVTFFSAYNIGGTFGTTTGYVYEAPNLSGTSAGWHQVEKATKISVQIGIDAIATGTRTIRIEGRTETDGRPCEIVTKSYNAITTIDEIVNVVEGLEAFRIGWNCGTTTADSVTVAAYIELED